jgi:hypothetical protein
MKEKEERRTETNNMRSTRLQIGVRVVSTMLSHVHRRKLVY